MTVTYDVGLERLRAVRVETPTDGAKVVAFLAGRGMHRPLSNYEYVGLNKLGAVRDYVSFRRTSPDSLVVKPVRGEGRKRGSAVALGRIAATELGLRHCQDDVFPEEYSDDPSIAGFSLRKDSPVKLEWLLLDGYMLPALVSAPWECGWMTSPVHAFPGLGAWQYVGLLERITDRPAIALQLPDMGPAALGLAGPRYADPVRDDEPVLEQFEAVMRAFDRHIATDDRFGSERPHVVLHGASSAPGVSRTDGQGPDSYERLVLCAPWFEPKRKLKRLRYGGGRRAVEHFARAHLGRRPTSEALQVLGAAYGNRWRLKRTCELYRRIATELDAAGEEAIATLRVLERATVIHADDRLVWPVDFKDAPGVDEVVIGGGSACMVANHDWFVDFVKAYVARS